MPLRRFSDACTVILAILTMGFSSAGLSSTTLFDRGDRHFQSFPALESLRANAIVLDIQQDSRGFIWLATTKELVRYDGYEFRPYRNDDSDPRSISGNYVQAIHFVAEQMWVGTYSDGISIYDPGTDDFSRLQHDPSDPDSLIGNDIRAITGTDELVVIATRSGVNLFHIATGRLLRLGQVEGCSELLVQGKLTSLAMDEASLFIGSSHGLCQISLDEQGLSDQPLEGTLIEALAERKIFNVEIMPDKRVWVSTTDRGVAVYRRDTQQLRWVPVDEGSPGALKHPWVDDTTLVAGDIWAATAGGGIAVIDPDTLEVKEHIRNQLTHHNGLSSNDVSAIFVSETGAIWIGTYGRGMNRLDPAGRAFRLLRHDPLDPTSLADPDIRSAIELQNGEIWLGSLTSGIQVLRSDAGLLRTYKPQPGQRGALQQGYVSAFEQLPNGEVWVGTGQSGVYRYNEASDDFTRFTSEQGLTGDGVRVLHARDNDKLWIGTNAGLTRYDTATGTFHAVGLRGGADQRFDHEVWSITSYNGELWVGSNHGLFVLPRDETALIPVASDPENPIADNFVKNLMVDSKGRLWVGTHQGTNILADWNGRTAGFLSVSRLLGNRGALGGNNMEEDRAGRIWAQQNLVDPSDWSYTRIQREVGWDNGGQWVGSNAKLRDGTLLFGGTQGLLMVRPEYYEAREQKPTIAITRVQVDSQAVPPALLNPLLLQASVKNFSIEFSSLNYSPATASRYEYMLEGYDDHWVSAPSSNRRASYSHLAPGNLCAEGPGPSTRPAIARRQWSCGSYRPGTKHWPSGCYSPSFPCACCICCIRPVSRS